MDIISHGLWSGALFEFINLKLKEKKFKFWEAAFWGMFPDIFAFVIPFFIFSIIIIIQKGFNLSNLMNSLQSASYSNIIKMLYNISHSLVIFVIVFFLVWLIFRKPIWVLCGWLLHILIDIPTHLKTDFPTQMFWPISNFNINGLIYWRDPKFMILDIVLLIVVYAIIFSIKRKNKKKKYYY